MPDEAMPLPAWLAAPIGLYSLSDAHREILRLRKLALAQHEALAAELDRSPGCYTLTARKERQVKLDRASRLWERGGE